jgi:putative ABC transport system permease protein
MLRDIRYSARLFRRSPAFSIAIALTLALGIGLTTAIFSVVDGVLLRPLPYSDPSALVTARTVSSEALVEWRSRTTALSGIAAYNFGVAPLLLTGEETVQLRQAAVSSNLLSVLGVRPVIGRDFLPADTEPGAEPVAMLTYGAWQQHFGGRPEIVGELAPFEPARRRVVGVLPADFIFPMRLLASVGEARMLTPIALTARKTSTFSVVARLNTGATVAQARAEERAIVSRPAPAGRVATASNVVPLATEMLGGSRPSLLMLFGAVGFLLLIACANAGGLLFAQGTDARREHAVRLAIGATRGQLVRLVIVQSVTLSVVGGLLGTLLAYLSFDMLMAFVPAQLPRAGDVAIDYRVLGFAFALSLASGAILGLLPAWHLSRVELHATLQAQGRATLPAQRLRLLVLATEIALAVVLLAGAALFANSFVRLLGVDLGFAPRNVLTLQVRLPESRYATPDRQRQFFEAALERITALPGVANVALVELLPVTRATRGGSVVAVGGRSAEPIEAEPRVVSHGYFETMGIAVVQGRSFNSRDSAGARPVAVVNEALARTLWPGENAVGQRIRYEKDEPREVIGIARDVRGYAVDTRPEPQVYIPHTQTWLVPRRLVVRTIGEPEMFTAAVRQQLRAVDPRAGVENIQPLTAHVAASIAQPRFQTFLLGIFGGTGLLLGVVGIGGVVAYAVARRRREIGIRIALGASGRDIVRTVVGASLTAAGIGLAAGLAAAVALSRLARAFLYEIEPHDPLTLSAVVIVVGAAAFAAAWLPARQAQRIDPLAALRAD